MNKYPNIFRNFVRSKHTKYFEKLKTYKKKKEQDPDIENRLPIYDYYSQKLNSRVYVWGRGETGALGLNLDPLKHSHNIKEPKRLKFAEQNNVTDLACGYGFTVFVVNDEKLYGTGINTDSQIGQHYPKGDHFKRPYQYLVSPQEIKLPVKQPEEMEVLNVSAGRAHLFIQTNEGLFSMGNNAYGQCGREVVADEKYGGSSVIHKLQFEEGEDQIENIQCGQDHTLVLSKTGRVYSCGWGADGQTGLGHFRNVEHLTMLEGDMCGEKITKISCTGDCVLALNNKGEVFGWGNSEYGQIPNDDELQQVSHPTHLDSKWGKIVDIAAGGSFCMVLNDRGEIYVWGYGLLGLGPNVEHSNVPLKLSSVLLGKNKFDPNCRIVEIHAGMSHMLALNSNGDLYSWGRNTAGNLGLGHLNDQYFPLKVSIGAFVKKVKCSVDHTICICEPFT